MGMNKILSLTTLTPISLLGDQRLKSENSEEEPRESVNS